ncbi:hypothetical protein [Weissella confusa]|uniref:hypothetical protein n=1 Tax=Weissella confusa TaxID=1583 RepID=UPI0021A37E07|nr:hypothetical protein [Weissella confusa]MCT2910384.1 hypothetical protein [Weissella confusa]
MPESEAQKRAKRKYLSKPGNRRRVNTSARKSHAKKYVMEASVADLAWLSSLITERELVLQQTELDLDM